MKRLAVFVEGQTEQIYLQSLIEEIAGKKRVHIQASNYATKAMTSLELTQPRLLRSDRKYFVLIMNCQNDERVKSIVLEQRPSLTKAGYSLILGLRDLYPKRLSDLAQVKLNMKYGVPTAGVPTYILLAVAEVEAWFLQDHTHYSRIDPGLDHSKFKAAFGFDPLLDSAEEVVWPSQLLNRIYQSAGKAYKKSRAHVERTARVLDYTETYINLASKLPHLRELIRHIDTFLT